MCSCKDLKSCRRDDLSSLEIAGEGGISNGHKKGVFYHIYDQESNPPNYLIQFLTMINNRFYGGNSIGL